jgi:hypothetical protein
MKRAVAFLRRFRFFPFALDFSESPSLGVKRCSEVLVTHRLRRRAIREAAHLTTLPGNWSRNLSNSAHLSYLANPVYFSVPS